MKSGAKKDWDSIFLRLRDEDKDIPLSFQNLKRWEEKYYPTGTSKVHDELPGLRKEKSLFAEAMNPMPSRESKRFKRFSWVAVALLFLVVGYFSRDSFLRQDSSVAYANPYQVTSTSPGVKIFQDREPIEPGNFQNQVFTENSVLLFSLGKNSYLELTSRSSRNPDNHIPDQGMRKIQLKGPGIYTLRYSNSERETWEMSHGRFLLIDQGGFASWELITDHAKYTKMGTHAYFETNPKGDKVAVLSGKILARIQDRDSTVIPLSPGSEFQLPNLSSSEIFDKNQENAEIPWKMKKLTPSERMAWDQKTQDFLSNANQEKTPGLSMDELRKRYPKLQKIEWKTGDRIEGYVYMRAGKWMVHTVEGIQEIDWERVQSIENF